MTISHVFMITVQVKNQLHITTKLTLNKEDFDHEYTLIYMYKGTVLSKKHGSSMSIWLR